MASEEAPDREQQRATAERLLVPHAPPDWETRFARTSCSTR
jgi:hypothetical protein